MKEIQFVVKKHSVKRYSGGYPLIEKGALESFSQPEEGQIIVLKEKDDTFLGRGYYGNQNKGLGWILSNTARERIDQAYFDTKLLLAYNKRLKLHQDDDTTAYRVFNGEGDGIGGLTIDFFAGYYLVTWYSKGIYHFREKILNALNKRGDILGLYEKKRFAEKGKYIEESSYISGTKAPEPLIVKESGVNFAIHLDDGAMVGVFLDQREVRKTLRDDYSKGKTVLNTFSYTGAYSIFAAVGGATKTTSVDLANRSLPKTREQFEVNNIKYEDHDIIVDDVFDYFKYAVRKAFKFDVVVLDPPAFAKSKKVDFSAARDYSTLIEHAIDLTEDSGVILASTNCATFDMTKFRGFVKTAFQVKGFGFHIANEYTLPKDFAVNQDFKEGDYLKVLFIKKRIL